MALGAAAQPASSGEGPLKISIKQVLPNIITLANEKAEKIEAKLDPQVPGNSTLRILTPQGTIVIDAQKIANKIDALSQQAICSNIAIGIEYVFKNQPQFSLNTELQIKRDPGSARLSLSYAGKNSVIGLVGHSSIENLVTQLNVFFELSRQVVRLPVPPAVDEQMLKKTTSVVVQPAASPAAPVAKEATEKLVMPTPLKQLNELKSGMLFKSQSGTLRSILVEGADTKVFRKAADANAWSAEGSRATEVVLHWLNQHLASESIVFVANEEINVQTLIG